ncbi:MAG: DUF2029 domain-containing protein [Alphaproteobacteria bacterium]|nr:DUF2029 domain-containing protein [Alphaproteobacteria bacterium]
MTPLLRKVLSWAAVLVAALAVVHAAQQSVLDDRLGRMSDALPLYLYAAAIAEGLNPLDPANLQAVYEARDMGVGAATWSTLYPPTTGFVLRPFAALSWADFEVVWGWLLLAAAVAVGLLIPAEQPRSPERDRVVRAAGVGLMALFPATAETARLGQVNMALAALAAGALVCVPRRRGLLGGALLGVGACLKLVPAAVALPLVAGRRWGFAVGGCLVGLPCVALALSVVSPEDFIEGVRATSYFQSTIAPAWLVREDLPAWGHHLGFARHNAMMLITAALSLGAALWRPSPAVLVGCGALVLAWLGMDASVFHLLYTPLYAPAWLWVCTWALQPAAPRWTWAVSLPLAVAGVWLPQWRLWADDTTFACMLLGLLVWAGTLLRTGHALSLAQERGPLAGLLERWPAPIAALGGLVAMVVFLRVGQPSHGPIPDALTSGPGGEIRHEGPGFIDPDVAPPGGFDAPRDIPAAPFGMSDAVPAGAERRWPMMTVTGSFNKGKRRHLDLHLRAAPGQWTALAQGPLAANPALAARATALAEAAPGGALSQVRYQHLATWLAAEGVLLHELEAAGVPAEPLRGEWAAAALP